MVSTEPVKGDNPLLKAKTASLPLIFPGRQRKQGRGSWTCLWKILNSFSWKSGECGEPVIKKKM